jgi:hypothetical protein
MLSLAYFKLMTDQLQTVIILLLYNVLDNTRNQQVLLKSVLILKLSLKIIKWFSLIITRQEIPYNIFSLG